MNRNNDQEDSKLKSMIQRIYSFFSMIHQKLNSVLGSHTNKFNNRTTLQYFSKMPELQSPVSKFYQNFASNLTRIFNFSFNNRIGGKNTSKEMELSNGNHSQHSFENRTLIQKDVSLFDNALKIIEMSKSLERNSIIRQAGKFKGNALSKDEISLTERFLEFINPLQTLVNFNGSDSRILTNSLTARGGFQGGAVVPSAQNPTKSINDKVSKIQEIMNEIKRLQNEMKDTVEKGLKV